MALVPSLDFAVGPDGLTTITDTTPYGAPERERNQVLVDFEIKRIQKNFTYSVSPPLYISSTVTNIQLPLGDGYYTVKIIIRDLLGVGQPIIATATIEYFRVDDLQKCMTAYMLDWNCAVCNCDPDRDEKRLKYKKAKSVLDLINFLVSELEFTEAECLLAGIQTMCEADPAENPCC